MEKRTTFVALDDSKRKVVIAILRPGATEPEQRELPKEPPLIQRLVREGPVQACYETGVSGYDLHRQITACGVACQAAQPVQFKSGAAGSFPRRSWVSLDGSAWPALGGSVWATVDIRPRKPRGRS